MATRSIERLRAWLRKPAVYVPLMVVAAAGWVAGVLAIAWDLPLNGSHRGILLHGNSTSLTLVYRWGWPSREWIGREHVRAGGNGPSYTWTPDEPLGFGVARDTRTWNGNDIIAVQHVAVQLPWWYLLLLGLATPLERLGRWVWAGRRSERRRRAGLCLGCGYDLRASAGRCPECGRPVPATGTAP